MGAGTQPRPGYPFSMKVVAGRRSVVQMLVVILSAIVVITAGGCGYLEPAETDDITMQAEPIGEVTLAQGFERQYYLIPQGMSRAEFVELAEAVHEFNPETWLWFLDDDAQVPALLKALPRLAKGDDAGFPLAWVAAHTVGHSVVEVDGESRTWVLYEGAETANRLVSRPLPRE